MAGFRATSSLQGKSSNDYDPLAIFTLPPPNETPSERQEREIREREAIERSHAIDAELRAAKHALKQHKKAIKIIVLGQSQSGKSTTVKNFQIAYAQKSWAEERLAWRCIILLNLVRSVNIMTMTLDTNAHPSSSSNASPSPADRQRGVVLRLTPLRQIEKDLKLVIGAGSGDVVTGIKFQSDNAQSESHDDKYTANEFGLRSSSGWKSVLARLQSPQSNKVSDLYHVACHVVRGCKDDIKWLWSDASTQQTLHSRGVRVENLPGFFLDDIDRITAEKYEPSDKDILCARLRTTGVQEYHFSLDRANGTTLNWIMYDVAGIRTSRAAWIPYFKDMTALIFLAPLSAFNERLPEDENVNCLEDSLSLWTMICSSKLLANIQLILFLNKMDIFRKKIEQDQVQVRKYIPEYDKPNDFENASTFFRRVFRKIYQHATPADAPKSFVSHFTSAVDIGSTRHTLQAVQEMVLRTEISEAGLM